MNTDVTMVKATPGDDNNNTVNTSSYPIMVELRGRMTDGGQSQVQGICNGQVYSMFLSVMLISVGINFLVFGMVIEFKSNLINILFFIIKVENVLSSDFR